MPVHVALLGGVLFDLQPLSHFLVLLILAWGDAWYLALDPSRFFFLGLAAFLQVHAHDNFVAVVALAIVNTLILCFGPWIISPILRLGLSLGLCRENWCSWSIASEILHQVILEDDCLLRFVFLNVFLSSRQLLVHFLVLLLTVLDFQIIHMTIPPRPAWLGLGVGSCWLTD